MEDTYHQLLLDILEYGDEREDRTGTGTVSLFGWQGTYDISENFPAVTTKRLFFKGVVAELLWFLRGETNVKFLQDHGVHIWDAWADEDGELGPVYGKQWRRWNDQDQIANVIESIKENPESRRHIVSAWNVAELDEMALPPCHLLFQFYVRRGQYLDCQLYQRSADAFLGVPFNIASYSLLTHIVSDLTGLKPGRFIHSIGDAHIYKNHLDQVEEQLSRSPFSPPTLQTNRPITSIDELTVDQFELKNYQSHPPIKAEIAV